MSALARSFGLLLLAPLLAACQVKPGQLTCQAITASYSLTLANGRVREGDLGCRAAFQATSPAKSSRRLLLRLDTAALIADDTGAAPDSGEEAAGWYPSDGVLVGLAWSAWNKRLNGPLGLEPWQYPLAEDQATMLGVIDAYARTSAAPETAALAAFVTPDGGGDPRVFRSSFGGGRLLASRYSFQKTGGAGSFLQLVADEIELEDGALLTIQADLSLTGFTELDTEAAP